MSLENLSEVSAIVLAAGYGKRMESNLPKVLHRIGDKRMIDYTLENLLGVGVGDVVVVVGYKNDEVIKAVQEIQHTKFAFQPQALGTADATSKGLEVLDSSCKTVIVLNGDDSAFYRPQTIREVIDIHRTSESVLTFVTLEKENPSGLGRIIRDRDGNVVRITEEKNASKDERKITEVNDGLYVIDRKWLSESLPKIKVSPQGEFFLVDLVGIAVQRGDKVIAYKLPDGSEWYGINTQEELEEANRKMGQRLMAKD